MAADFSLISSEMLFNRISEELSTYSSNSLLDVAKFYPQLVWFSQQLGLSVFGYEEVVINLNNHRAELPCNFYLMDSAWLCDEFGYDGNEGELANGGRTLNFQAKAVVYTERSCETVLNHANLGNPDPDGLYPYSVDACVQDTVLARTTTREYVISDHNDEAGRQHRRWHNPILLRLNNRKSVRNLCTHDCQNLFSKNPNEISINKQGSNYYLYSTLKNPIIYVKYFAYPLGEDGLPLIPEDRILQEALFKHLVAYFLRMLWTNGEDNNMADKVKYWDAQADLALGQAKTLIKLPSFNNMIQMGRRVRNKWNSFEVLGSIKHW